MSISAAYLTPVTVNGFLCRNCTDVDFAKKHIDPQHPRSGPYGIDTQDDPTQPAAVRFGGSRSAPNGAAKGAASWNSAASPPNPGTQFDLMA